MRAKHIFQGLFNASNAMLKLACLVLAFDYLFVNAIFSFIIMPLIVFLSISTLILGIIRNIKKVRT
jgi:hypothetical protein